MELIKLNSRPGIEKESRLEKAFNVYLIFFEELTKRELTDKVVLKLNAELETINATANENLMKQLRVSRSTILKTLEAEMKLVTAGHYRNVWMAIGIGAFGVPFGVAFGASLGNMAFLGLGLPIGMSIGIAIGSGMDQKALKEGRQLKTNLTL